MVFFSFCLRQYLLEGQIYCDASVIEVADNIVTLPSEKGATRFIKLEPGNINLELGDIIKIVSPLNETTNNNIYIIDYINSTLIKLINTETSEVFFINIDEEGNLSEDYITEIILLDRNDTKGYAQQNELNINTWIDVHFNGDLPFILTGMITNVEKDMIEINTYPEGETIYIDFAYQGIPPELNIQEINTREEPVDKKEEFQDIETDDYELDAYVIPDEVEATDMNTILIDADELFIGEELK